MNELAIQAEVGRRLRAAIGRAHKGHALKVNSRRNDDGGKNDDITALIEQLIESGAFTSADKTGLQALAPDTIRAIAEKFSGDEPEEEAASEGGEIEEVITKFNCTCRDEKDYSDFIHAGRPQALRHDLPEQRAMRNYRIANAHHRKMVANAREDEIAKGMLPPSSRRAS